MKVILAINGLPGSGKDEFAKQVSKYANVKNFSTIDFVKEVAKFAGWDGQKTDKARLLLSQLKEILTKFDDIPYQKTMEAVREFKKNPEQEIMFIHVRERNEIERLVRELKVKTLIIRRPDNRVTISNDSDRFVESYGHYDFLLNNDSDIESLNLKADSFVKYLRATNGGV